MKLSNFLVACLLRSSMPAFHQTLPNLHPHVQNRRLTSTCTQVIDFDTFTECKLIAGDFYQNSTGVVIPIRGAYSALNDTCKKFSNEPSPSTVMFFSYRGDYAILNIPNGFDIGFSFYYSSISTNATFNVYDEVNGDGNNLAKGYILALGNSGSSDPQEFNIWEPLGVTFQGLAKSVTFASVDNVVLFDDLTFGSATPGLRNSLPTALCQNATFPAIQNCAASPTPEEMRAVIDGGSSDPDGDNVTFHFSSVGPFAIGDTDVVMSVTDSCGSTDTCTATVTVVDDEVPSVDCGNIGIIAPCEQPVTVNFAPGTKENGCDSPNEVDISNIHVNCSACNRGSNQVMRNCLVNTTGSSAVIIDAGGVASHIIFNVKATNRNRAIDGAFLNETKTCTICTQNPSSTFDPDCPVRRNTRLRVHLAGTVLSDNEYWSRADSSSADSTASAESGSSDSSSSDSGDWDGCSSVFPDATMSCGV